MERIAGIVCVGLMMGGLVAEIVAGQVVAPRTTSIDALPVPRALPSLPQLDEATAARALGTSTMAVATVAAPSFTLVGTLVSAYHDDASLAALGGGSRVRLVSAGERIAGAEVVRIEPRRVVLRWQDQEIELVPGPTQGLRPSEPPATNAPDSPPCTGATCMIGAAEVQAALANLPALGRDGRLVPAFRDGRAQGYKIFQIRPGSLYERLGLQNGDVIRRIDGTDLSSMEAVMALYQRARTTNRVEVEIDRRGATVRRVIQVEGTSAR